jgi:small acid-soluble spore protein H (minor)
MNIQRAQEIAASPVMENVEYDGDRVYIQHVDEQSETARIYPLDRPETEMDVPVRSLYEPGAQVAMEVESMACREGNES